MKFRVSAYTRSGYEVQLTESAASAQAYVEQFRSRGAASVTIKHIEGGGFVAEADLPRLIADEEHHECRPGPKEDE